MISKRDGQITLADDFKILALISSKPVALFGSKPVALFGSNEFIIDSKS